MLFNVMHLSPSCAHLHFQHICMAQPKYYPLLCEGRQVDQFQKLNFWLQIF